jgi:hypothetical protein
VKIGKFALGELADTSAAPPFAVIRSWMASIVAGAFMRP